MNNFQYFNPTRVIFGKNVVDSLAAEIKKAGAGKILLVYGQNSIKSSGLYDRIKIQFTEYSIDVIEHGGVKGNPLLSHAEEGVKKAKESNVDWICAVGGGSVIDEAKAIAAGAVSDIDIWKFYAKEAPVEATLPLAAVSTLPATSSEMNGISVLTNDQTQQKAALVCPGIMNPKLAFLDPELTRTLSSVQLAFAAADIISHLTEAYFTTSAAELCVQDRLTESLVLSVMDSHNAMVADPGDYNSRAAFTWSAALAWSGIVQAGIPFAQMPCHGLEMPMSGIYDVAHGAGLSVIIPAWIKAVGKRHESRILKFGRNVFGRQCTSVAEVADLFIEYYRSIGTPVSFVQAGMPDPDIDKLAFFAFESFTQRGVSGYDPDVIKNIYGHVLFD